MFHRGMIGLREEEADPGLLQTALGCRRFEIDADAERLQHIGAAGARRHVAIAMLGDRHATGGDHKGGCGRNIQGAVQVAAGAAQIDGAVRNRDRAHRMAHGACGPRKFLRGGLAHGEGCEKGSHADGRNLAGHQQRKRARGRLLAQFLAGRQHLQNRAETVRHRFPLRQAGAKQKRCARHAGMRAWSRVMVRKFCSSACPCSDAMLSGWNCTP